MYRPLNTLSRMRRWLLPESPEARRATRFADPEIVVHYWDGSAPGGRGIRDISEGGAYIYTGEGWYPGTVIRVVLQAQRMTIEDDGARTPAASVCVTSTVVRNGDDGVAVAFTFASRQEQENFRTFLAAIPLHPAALSPAPAAPSPAPASTHRTGQALVEFALIIPMMLMLAVNAVNFGGFIFAWITVANAARSGAQYMVMSSASPGKPTAATSGQVTTLVTNDITSLLNRSSLVVATCTNATSSSNGCTTLSDPEAPAYTLATVDVTYTYQPFIPLFSFPSLGISATLPATSIHRKAVMRMLQ